MSILDRYIVRLFLVNFVILFTVLVVMVVLMDLIANFDEFVQTAQNVEGSWTDRTWHTLTMIVDFYAPMILLLFVYLAGLVPGAAAAFTLAGLVRHRELTAVLAGGVSMHRVAAPILILGFGINLLALANQEFLLPGLASKLGRSQSDIKHGQVKAFEVQFVPDGQGSLFTAASFDMTTQTMHSLSVLRRGKSPDGLEGIWGRTLERISAESATWNGQRGGWELVNGFGLTLDRASQELDSTARREVAFVTSDLDPIMILMRKRVRFRQLLSMGQLDDLIAKPQLVDADELRRIRHTRFSAPVANMLILAMSLPFFLLRVPDRLLATTLKATPLVVGAWGLGVVAWQIPAAWMNPVAVAWLPVAILLPLTVWIVDGIET